MKSKPCVSHAGMCTIIEAKKPSQRISIGTQKGCWLTVLSLERWEEAVAQSHQNHLELKKISEDTRDVV